MLQFKPENSEATSVVSHVRESVTQEFHSKLKLSCKPKYIFKYTKTPNYLIYSFGKNPFEDAY